MDPLIFDIDGDGVELSSLEDSNVFFDLNGNGFAERTGWVLPDDALLARDLNSSGTIDDIDELFGNATTPGLVKLAELDSNNDGVINSSDAAFNSLRLWQDANQNGVSEAGELKALQDYNITSIALAATPVNSIVEGNVIAESATYERGDGTFGSLAEVYFSVDNAHTIAVGDGGTGGNLPVNIETLLIPLSRGYGTLTAWHIAMTDNAALFAKMQEIINTSPENFNEIGSLVKEFLYEWAGITNVSPTGRGVFIDGQKLAFLEKFSGEDFIQTSTNSPNPDGSAAAFLNAAWEGMYDFFYDRIVLQGVMKDVLDVHYDFASDSLVFGDSVYDSINMAQNASLSFRSEDSEVAFWLEYASILKEHAGEFSQSGAELNTAINGLLQDKLHVDTSGISSLKAGTENSDNLFSTLSDNILFSGGEGDDTINAGNGDNVILGGSGNDFIAAGSGNNTVFGGDGDDTIYLNYGNNEVYGDAGNDRIYGYGILNGGDGDDLISGGGTITGGIGEDVLYGDVADTTFIYNKGDGNDLISDNNNNNNNIQFGVGINYSDLIFSLTGGPALAWSGNNWSDNTAGYGVNLRITFAGNNNDSIILMNYIGFGELHFASGEVVNLANAALPLQPLSGSEGNDQISGSNFDDTINALGGDDRIDGGDGNDTLYGGAGNDKLYGGRSDDTIEGGDGNDIIYGYFEWRNDYWMLNYNQGDTESRNLLSGGAGDDIIFGEAGNDIIDGGLGNDTISGGYGSDTIFGGDGNDIIYSHGEWIYGRGDYTSNTLNGGTGDDVFYSNNSIGNTYIFNRGDGHDIINDLNQTIQFGAGIALSDISFEAGNVSDTNVSQRGGLLIKIKNGDSYDSILINEFLYNVSDDGWNAMSKSVHITDKLLFADGAIFNLSDISTITINGTENNDNITGSASHDVIYGGGGDDTINATPPGVTEAIGDEIHGGDGNDSIYAGYGINEIYGDAGNDSISGIGILNGGAGDDTINGGGTIIGGIGNDSLHGAGNDNTYIYNIGDGNDLISDSTYNPYGAANINILQFGEGINYSDLIFSLTGGPSTWWSGSWSDNTAGYGVNLRITFAGNNSDSIILISSQSNGTYTGFGELHFASGEVINLANAALPLQPLSGSEGNDQIHGSNSDDTINSFGGDDTVYGNDGNDTLYGGAGNDKLYGGYGLDIIDGGDGNDTIYGNTQWAMYRQGYDLSQKMLYGGAGDDIIYGDAGNDIIEGGTGNDTLYGGDGSDTLISSDGNDILSGDWGVDKFVITKHANTQTTINFESGEVIDLTAFTNIKSFDDLLINGNAPLIDLGDSQQIKISNSFALTAANFIFAQNHAPVISTQIPSQQFRSGDEVNISLDNSFTDIDGDALTYSIKNSDGTVAPEWLSINPVTMVLAGIAPVGFSGLMHLTLVADDANGGVATQDFDVNILSNNTPTATLTAASGDEDTAITIDVLSSASDIDGDVLSISAVTDAQNGSAIIQDSKILYTPTANYNGTDTFNYTIDDGHGGSVTNSITITVNPVNDLPAASNVAESILEDNQYIISIANLLAKSGASDIDSDILTISSVQNAINGVITISNGNVIFTPAANYNGVAAFDFTVNDSNGGTITQTVNLTVDALNNVPTATLIKASGKEDTVIAIDVLAKASDIDGDVLTISAVTDAQHGSVAIQNGKILYTPNANYNGTDTFNYTIDDGHGGSVTKALTVTVKPVNDAPVASDINISGYEDVQYIINAASLLAEAAASDIDSEALFIKTVQGAKKGTVAFNQETQEITFTPNANYNGAASFSYTISDGNKTITKTAYININPVNDAPTATLVAASVNEDKTVTIDVLAKAKDIDGDVLSISAVTNAQHGNAIFQNGKILYTPNANYNGTDIFNYTISDGQGGSITNSITVTVKPINDAPVLSSQIENQNVTTGTAFHIELGDNLFSDIDGDSLSYSLKQKNNSAVPEWISLDIATMTINGTAPADFTGSLKLKLVASDGHGGTSSQSFDIVTYTPVQNGTSANDTLNGAAGNDTINGLNGNDTIRGYNGNDVINGGAGNDSLFGGSGKDYIFGGIGADKLTGGAGNDVFHYENLVDSKQGSYDTIQDFTVGQDRIDLTELFTFGIDSFTDLAITQDTTNNKTIITANDNANPDSADHFELHLKGIIDLHQEDFIWA